MRLHRLQGGARETPLVGEDPLHRALVVRERLAPRPGDSIRTSLARQLAEYQVSPFEVNTDETCCDDLAEERIGAGERHAPEREIGFQSCAHLVRIAGGCEQPRVEQEQSTC